MRGAQTEKKRGVTEDMLKAVMGKGSSPRMRGAPLREIEGLKCNWIIPADAGSTVDDGLEVLGVKDHPRGCGEHFMAPGRVAALNGSSPRMRGAPCRLQSQILCARIIPTNAGNTP